MRKLAWIGMRRRKKQMYIVLTAVVLSMVFFLSAAIVRESVTATVRKERLESYGMWTGAFYNGSEAQRESLEKEPFVENIGEMRIYGTLLDERGKETGGIGTMDEEMIRLGQIQLKEGSFPQKDNEIAMGEKTLKRLGIEDRLGTEVKVRVYHDTAEGEEEELSFVLCGILKDYSSNWKRDYSQLVTGVVSEVWESEKFHLFFYGKEYEEIQKIHKLDVLVKSKQDGNLTINNLAYEKDKVFLEKVLENGLLTIFLAMISAVIILYIQLIQFQGRRNTLLTMRGIGSSKAQILSLLLWEDVYVLRYALPLGIVMGMCIPCGALYFMGFQVMVSMWSVLSAILISAGVFFIDTLGLYLSVRNLEIEASFRVESNVTKRKHLPKIRRVKALTPMRMLIRKRKFEGRKSVIRSAVLLLGSIAAILGTVSTIFLERI